MSKSVLYYIQRFNCNLPSAIVFKKIMQISHQKNHAIYVQVHAVFQTLVLVFIRRGFASNLLCFLDGENISWINLNQNRIHQSTFS